MTNKYLVMVVSFYMTIVTFGTGYTAILPPSEKQHKVQRIFLEHAAPEVKTTIPTLYENVVTPVITAATNKLKPVLTASVASILKDEHTDNNKTSVKDTLYDQFGVKDNRADPRYKKITATVEEKYPKGLDQWRGKAEEYRDTYAEKTVDYLTRSLHLIGTKTAAIIKYYSELGLEEGPTLEAWNRDAKNKQIMEKECVNTIKTFMQQNSFRDFVLKQIAKDCISSLVTTSDLDLSEPEGEVIDVFDWQSLNTFD